MPHELSFKLLPSVQSSDYRWLNIDRNGQRVGKARGRVDDNVLTIHSITIFPEFEGNNYGSKTIEFFKEHFNTVIADRVRPTAIGFWEKMGFSNNGDGSYIFHKKGHCS
ncbi:GNAT family N-acetyltransferase [Methanolobus mangrovi]|uniref:GNAT family N-acetyltransferase n=1 Tax=Methanolobus mangrovi TaxID=3072977 RepID=A0AA51UDJ1_9EURY|nr:GNAT family N-acetyltransferase [Methanolobus mangrovi]WMW21028.1 GNAT family N-acetyltransferase [Methanolobus mangrovi]